MIQIGVLLVYVLGWTSCKRWSLEWAASTGTQPCTVFGYKDFCGSTALGTPESVGMNGQIDWQAQQISHLVCSLAGQRCSEAWGTFSTRTSQSITALMVWRKEEWKKEAADIPPSKVDNDLCSTRQILALFRGQPWGDCWETGRSANGPFRALRCHLELKLKLKLSDELRSQWEWTGRETGKHSRYHIWSAAWQGRGAPRLEELSQHGQARASQHWWSEGKRSGERKWPTFHPPRSRTIYVQPGKYWHCFEGNLGETAERRDGARMGLSERYDAILSWNWNWSSRMNFVLMTTDLVVI